MTNPCKRTRRTMTKSESSTKNQASSTGYLSAKSTSSRFLVLSSWFLVGLFVTGCTLAPPNDATVQPQAVQPAATQVLPPPTLQATAPPTAPAAAASACPIAATGQLPATTTSGLWPREIDHSPTAA